ncbi:Rmf/CrpP family protein [Streptomyces pseudogriseolus]|uniref:Rmf/CrpP family protein n=1 Tax=Streptomyces pseudogriseolus TaxID=36817 RepID=UPI003FA2C2A9
MRPSSSQEGDGESAAWTHPRTLQGAVEEGLKASQGGESYLTCQYPRPSALRTAWISGYYGTAPGAARQSAGRGEEPRDPQ